MNLADYNELQTIALNCLSEKEQSEMIGGFDKEGVFNKKNKLAVDLAHYIQFAILDLIPIYGRKQYQFSSTFKEKRKVTAVSRTIELRNGLWESKVQLMILQTGKEIQIVTYTSVYNSHQRCLELFEKDKEPVSIYDLLELFGFLHKTSYEFPKVIDYQAQIQKEVLLDEEESDENYED